MRSLIAALLMLLACGADAATVRDSRGEQVVPDTPRRVVVLSWALAEMLIELDIAPVGIAEIEGYKTWVAAPPLPDLSAEVGLRREPNFEAIAALEPDLIIAADDQIDFVDTLERIAPTLHFDLFDAAHDNHAYSREVYLVLGRLFDREALARRRLDALDKEIAGLRARLLAHFGGEPPKVTSVQFIDAAHVRVQGANSLAQAALRLLGIESGYPQPRSDWGFALKRLEDLGAIEQGYVVQIDPFPQADDVIGTPLWSFMPFVREDRYRRIPPAWTFGGPFSTGRMARGFAHALLREGR